MTTLADITDKNHSRKYNCEICKDEFNLKDMVLIRNKSGIERMIICKQCNTPVGWKRINPESVLKKKVDKSLNMK